VSSDQLRAMEANMQFHMTYFANRVPPIERCDEPDITVVRSLLGDDTFNTAIGARFNEESARERVAHVMGLFEGRPFAWWVSPSDCPSTLHSLLKAAGLRAKEEDIGMSLDVDTFTFARSKRELSIARACDVDGMKRFAILFESIGGLADGYEQLFRYFPPILQEKEAPVEVYIGSLKERAIAAALLVTGGGGSSLQCLMVDPAYRKMGYGRDMAISLILRAQEKGTKWLFLQSSSMGKGLYQQLGFRPLCRFVEYG